jgi:lathosterol oxidase
MDWLAGSRTHFVDIFVTRSMTFIPLYVFGFSEITFNTYIIFMAIHAVLIHANTRINFGFFKVYHCHSTISSLAPLPGAGILWKKISRPFFHSLIKYLALIICPVRNGPKEPGCMKPISQKVYIKQLVYPFTKSPFDDNLQMEDKTKR